MNQHAQNAAENPVASVNIKSVADTIQLMKEAQTIIESYPLHKRFIRATPLDNDIACWMAEFALDKIKSAITPATAELQAKVKECVDNGARAFGQILILKDELNDKDAQLVQLTNQLTQLQTVAMEKGQEIHSLKQQLLASESARKLAVEALNKLASWGEGEVVTSSFDCPNCAETARNALSAQPPIATAGEDVFRNLLKDQNQAVAKLLAAIVDKANGEPDRTDWVGLVKNVEATTLAAEKLLEEK